MSPSIWSIKRVVNELSDRKQAATLLRERIESDDQTEQRIIHGITAQWDGRFLVQWPASGHGGIFVAALGAEGRRQICAGGSRVGAPIPTPALPSLPAFWDGQGLAAVPHLSYVRPAMGNSPVGCVIFQPNQPFVPPHFAVARAPSDPI